MASKILAIALLAILSLSITSVLQLNPAPKINAQFENQSIGETQPETNLTEGEFNVTSEPEPTTTEDENAVIAANEMLDNAAADENQTAGNETASNLTQVKEQAIPLLDEAETNIQDVRDLIRGLQEALAEAQGGGQEIVDQANESATEIIDIIKENVTIDQPVIDQVGNASEDVVQAINATINGTITPEESENVTEVADEVVDVVEEATEAADNTTVTAQVDTAMIRLLTGLVDAQDYTALPFDQKASLKADLAETIANLADDSADKIREGVEG